MLGCVRDPCAYGGSTVLELTFRCTTAPHDGPKQVGMIVAMSGQGLERRKDTGRSDPSRGSVGSIVRVNENWTAGESVRIFGHHDEIFLRALCTHLQGCRSPFFERRDSQCSKKMWMGDIVCSLPPTHCLRRYFPFFSQMLSGMRPARSGRVTRVEALQGGARRVRFTSSLYPTTQSSLRTCAMEEQAMQGLTRITSTSTSTRISRTTLDRTGTTPGKGITVTRQGEMLAGRWHSMAK